jgi:hypothetical protein
MSGKLVFYGAPDEALEYFQATNFKELYERLEEPIEQKNGGQAAEEWKLKFAKTAQYRKNISEPLKEIGAAQSGSAHQKKRLGVSGAFRQFFTLSRRYAEALFKDRLNLLILFAQAPIIAVLTFFVMGANQPRDFVISCCRSSPSGSEPQSRRAKLSGKHRFIGVSEWSISVFCRISRQKFSFSA